MNEAVRYAPDATAKVLFAALGALSTPRDEATWYWSHRSPDQIAKILRDKRFTDVTVTALDCISNIEDRDINEFEMKLVCYRSTFIKRDAGDVTKYVVSVAQTRDERWLVQIIKHTLG